jgi:hypothetical protein
MAPLHQNSSLPRVPTASFQSNSSLFDCYRTHSISLAVFPQMKETAARVLVTWVVLLFLAVAVLCASPVRSTISTPEWQNNFSDLPKVVFLVVFSPHLTRICHFVFGRNVLFVAKTLRARQNFLDDIFVFKIHFCFRFPLSALDLCCNAD